MQNEKTPLKLAMEKGHSSVVSYIERLQEQHAGTVGGRHEVCLSLMYNCELASERALLTIVIKMLLN